MKSLSLISIALLTGALTMTTSARAQTLVYAPMAQPHGRAKRASP